MTVSLQIPGKPRTKKNSGRRFYSFTKKQTFNIPSEAHEEWAIAAARELRRQWAGRPPLEGRLHVRASIFRDARRGDLVGFEQAIGDVLEAAKPKQSVTTQRMKAGIIVDDEQIDSWDGSRRYVDKENPRVELEITTL